MSVGKNSHYHKPVDICSYKYTRLTLFLRPDCNILLHGASIVAVDDVPAQVFPVSIKLANAKCVKSTSAVILYSLTSKLNFSTDISSWLETKLDSLMHFNFTQHSSQEDRQLMARSKAIVS